MDSYDFITLTTIHAAAGAWESTYALARGEQG
jgi:hypothetical protein